MYALQRQLSVSMHLVALTTSRFVAFLRKVSILIPIVLAISFSFFLCWCVAFIVVKKYCVEQRRKYVRTSSTHLSILSMLEDQRIENASNQAYPHFAG